MTNNIMRIFLPILFIHLFRSDELSECHQLSNFALKVPIAVMCIGRTGFANGKRALGPKREMPLLCESNRLFILSVQRKMALRNMTD